MGLTCQAWIAPSSARDRWNEQGQGFASMGLISGLPNQAGLLWIGVHGEGEATEAIAHRFGAYLYGPSWIDIDRDAVWSDKSD